MSTIDPPVTRLQEREILLRINMAWHCLGMAKTYFEARNAAGEAEALAAAKQYKEDAEQMMRTGTTGLALRQFGTPRFDSSPCFTCDTDLDLQLERQVWACPRCGVPLCETHRLQEECAACRRLTDAELRGGRTKKGRAGATSTPAPTATEA